MNVSEESLKMSRWIQAKTIVEEKDVELAVNKAQIQYSRFGETWDGLKWLLARNGENISASHKVQNDVKYHLYKSDPIIEGMPYVTILYTMAEDIVTIHAIEISEKT